MNTPTPDDVAFAESLVDEALNPFDHVLEEELRIIIRETLLTDLLYTKEGRALLREARPDPTVDRSGDTTAPAAVPPKRLKSRR